MSVVEIKKVERDTEDSLETGEIVVVPYALEVAPNKQIILPGTRSPENLQWGISWRTSSAAFQYMIAAPSADAPEIDRLHYYWDHVTNSDSEIAQDAAKGIIDLHPNLRDEFANCPHRHAIREKLKKLVSSESALADQIVACSLILGHCGDRNDLDYLESLITKASEEYRPGLEGVMIGYLLHSGDRGMRKLEKTIIKNENSSFSDAYATIQSMRYLWDHGDGCVSKQQLKSSMRSLLNRPDLADITIMDLTKWNDWQAMDDIVDLFDQEEFQVPAIKRAIVRYLLKAKQSGEKLDDEDLPEVAIDARKHLSRLRSADPKIVKQAERYFFD